VKPFGKPVREKIIYKGGFPIILKWQRGKINETPFLMYHRELEFHYIKRGEGAYLIKNQNYAFGRCSVLVIRANEIHSFIPNPESYIEKGTIIFDPALLKAERWLARFHRIFPHHLVLPEDAATRMEIVFDELGEEKRKKEKYWRETVALKLKELLLIIKRAFFQAPAPRPVDSRMSRILVFIENNFRENLSRGCLSREFALSPGYLSRLFKKHTGLNLKQYILQRRIIEAKKLLTDQPDLKVTSIPSSVGFSDFALFNRSFKQITGLTPSVYRTISHQEGR